MYLTRRGDIKTQKDGNQQSKKTTNNTAKGGVNTHAKKKRTSSGTKTAADYSKSAVTGHDCTCGSCKQVFGDLAASKADEDWLCCSWFHESCAEETGLVDVAEFICGPRFH